MGDLLIRNIPEPIKAELSKSAARSGRSLSEEAKYRLRKSLETDSDDKPTTNPFDIIRSAFIDAGGGDGEFARVMDEIEAEGKGDFGRVVEDFE